MGMPWDSVADLIKDGIDKIWPDKTEADKARAALEQAQLAGQLKDIEGQWQNASQQIDVNKAEAANTNSFVSGWRPFIGWVCGSAFAWQFVIQPLLIFFLSSAGYPIDLKTLPVFDQSQISPVLYGMLGLGAMRSFEKIKNVAAK